MTDHFPTQPTCDLLKETGFPQETLYYWHKGLGREWQIITRDQLQQYLILRAVQEYCAAPLFTEMLEQLPKRLFHGEYNNETGDPIYESLMIEWENDKLFSFYSGPMEFASVDGNPAECLAKMWLLIEQKRQEDEQRFVVQRERSEAIREEHDRKLYEDLKRKFEPAEGQ